MTARQQPADYCRQLEEVAKLSAADLALTIIDGKVRAAILATYPVLDMA